MGNRLLILLVFSLFASVAFGLKCYSSNGQSRKTADNGESVECRDAAGATLRYCVKFKTDSRPGKVFRECDHVYEQLFGYDTFRINGPGCWPFKTKIGEIEEKGTYCACREDNCNTGDAADEQVAK